MHMKEAGPAGFRSYNVVHIHSTPQNQESLTRCLSQDAVAFPATVPLESSILNSAELPGLYYLPVDPVLLEFDS